MSEALKPCPCGKVPSKLILCDDPDPSFMEVQGDCGCDWSTIYRVSVRGIDNNREKAIEVWNSAPRGWLDA